MRVEILFANICSSLNFILFLRYVNLFNFLFRLSLGYIVTCFTNTTSSLFLFLSVSLANLPLGCMGTCLTNMTSSCASFFLCFLPWSKFLVAFLFRNHLLQTILESTIKNKLWNEHLAVLKCKTKTRFK